MHAATVENSTAVPKKVKTELLYDPPVPLLSIYLKELKAKSGRIIYKLYIIQWNTIQP